MIDRVKIPPSHVFGPRVARPNSKKKQVGGPAECASESECGVRLAKTNRVLDSHLRAAESRLGPEYYIG